MPLSASFFRAKYVVSEKVRSTFVDKYQRNYLASHFQKAVKVKVKFTLEQAMKAERGSRGVALLFL
jgi:hypothetical protein